MPIRSVLLLLLPLLATANPLFKRWDASADVGSTTSDTFPPASTSADLTEFPPESIVGFAGATPTGEAPLPIQTAPVYPTNEDSASSYPLVTDQPEDNPSEPFDIKKSWGLFSPFYSVPSSHFGLPDTTTPKIPDGCDITQVHILYRHGARAPTGAPVTTFATKLEETRQNVTWSAWGELEFLTEWVYGLGLNILVPFGRLENFQLGMTMRQEYGKLLNNFPEAGTLPVFRTQSLDRMVKTANNFAAGFFGVPEYLEQVNIELDLETPGFNTSGAPYGICTNGNNAPYATNGGVAGTIFLQNNFNDTIARLNSQVSGIKFDYLDIFGMIQICTFETVQLGYSEFCQLFTEEDFKNFDYYWDLDYWYGLGPGSPISAAMGLGMLQEFYARLSQKPITVGDSSVNVTLDSDHVHFPLNQSIYADATHESIITWFLMAMNLTAVFGDEPLPIYHRPEQDWVFRTSKIIPYATHFVVQVVECPQCTPTKQARFIINDAVLPLDKSYTACPYNVDGLCALDSINDILKARIAEIDFDTACFGNFTFELGKNYNGLVPPGVNVV